MAQPNGGQQEREFSPALWQAGHQGGLIQSTSELLKYPCLIRSNQLWLYYSPLVVLLYQPMIGLLK